MESLRLLTIGKSCRVFLIGPMKWEMEVEILADHQAS